MRKTINLYTLYKMRVMLHNCVKKHCITIACLKFTIGAADTVLIEEPVAFQDQNNSIKQIYTAHNASKVIRPTAEKPIVIICHGQPLLL